MSPPVASMVGAKTEIYSLIKSLAAEGRAVLVISSEHLELFGLCDRVLGHAGRASDRKPSRPQDYSEEKTSQAGDGQHVPVPLQQEPAH